MGPYRPELLAYDFGGNPTGGETWTSGETHTVRWRGANPADVALSLDGGLYFDRPTRFAGQGLLQTLEPRVYYLYSEFEEQKDQPDFDSAEEFISNHPRLEDVVAAEAAAAEAGEGEESAVSPADYPEEYEDETGDAPVTEPAAEEAPAEAAAEEKEEEEEEKKED